MLAMIGCTSSLKRVAHVTLKQYQLSKHAIICVGRRGLLTIKLHEYVGFQQIFSTSHLMICDTGTDTHPRQ